MTVTELHQQTEENAVELFEQSIKYIFSGEFDIKEQHEFPERGKQYFYLRKDIDTAKKIDCNWDDEKIDRHVRATFFPPFPPPYTIKNGEKIELDLNWKAKLK